jgi:hypothetical protein
MAIPAGAIAIPLVRLAWDLGKRAAETPAGKHLLRQGTDMVKKAVNSDAFQHGTRHHLTTSLERAGLHPTGAQAVTMAVNDLALRDPDGKLRPALVEQSGRAARAVGRLFKHG